MILCPYQKHTCKGAAITDIGRTVDIGFTVDIGLIAPLNDSKAI